MRILLLTVLVVLGLDIWLLLRGASNVPFGLWPIKGQVLLPPGLLPLLGLAIGIAGTLLASAYVDQRTKPETSESSSESSDTPAPQSLVPRPDGLALAIAAVGATFSLLVVLGVAAREVRAVEGAALLISGFIAAAASLYAVDALRRGEAIEFSSHWGGLGGSIGGWRISPVTTLILIALIFTAATVTAGTRTKDGTAPADTPNQAAKPGGAAENPGTKGTTTGTATDAGQRVNQNVAGAGSGNPPTTLPAPKTTTGVGKAATTQPPATSPSSK